MRVWRDLEHHGITFASFGRVKRTASLSEPVHEAYRDWDRTGAYDGKQKQAHAAQHLFLFAAENDIADYYHTEKVFHGLMSGTVPVYWGGDTIDDYVPDDSVIKVRSFSSLQRLSVYLKRLADNETLYNRWLTWRHRPLPERVTRKLRAGRYWRTAAWRCQVCRYLTCRTMRGSNCSSGFQTLV